MDPDLLRKSCTQTGITNTGNVDLNVLHSKLKSLVVDDTAVEEIQQLVDKEKMADNTADVSGIHTDDEEEEEDPDNPEQDLGVDKEGNFL